MRNDFVNSCFCWNGGLFINRVLIKSYCLCLGVKWFELVATAKIFDLWERPSEPVVIVTWEAGGKTWCIRSSSRSDTIRVELDKEIVAVRVSGEDGFTKTCGRFNKGVRWWSRCFGVVIYGLDWGYLPK